MTTSSLALCGCACAVFIAALIAIIYNRRQLQQLRTPQHEPIMGRAAADKTETLRHNEHVDNYGVGEVRIKAIEVKLTDTSKNSQHANAAPQERAEAMQTQDVIMLSVMSEPNRPYIGYELLQSLLAAGLRYGKMKIFHRHEQASGQGPILFSLASATNPGVFELDKMSTVICKGLTLFMQVSHVNDVAQTFDLMLETAKQLIDDLGGQLYDDQRQPLTEQRIKELRDFVHLFERNRATVDMFD